MDNASYVALSRQSGLMKEMNLIANNIANSDTVGYKKQGAIFSEYVSAASSNNSSDVMRESLSMGRLAAHADNFQSGGLRSTGGALDVAIDGDGFFLVNVDGQERLTRAGHFMTDVDGRLITTDGHAVLDGGGGEITIPLESGQVKIAGDGTLSADGFEIGQIGIVTAAPNSLERQGSNNWIAADGYVPVDTPRLAQGFLEDSNVDPVTEIARMIEVQRHYDAGQNLLEMDDKRIKGVITTIRQLA